MSSRYFMILRTLFIKSPMKRVEYLKKHNVFRKCGNRVMINSRKIPLYPNLISIGNNVWIASGVNFVTHDVIHYMLNGLGRGQFTEKVGCIDIGDNVFIGSNSQIMYDVKIGNNVVIAAGSCVTKDIPDNSVVGGVPAKVIGDFESLVKKRAEFKLEHEFNKSKQEISKEREDEIWEQFYKIKNK